ncbi:hypothetical protein DFH09DRAFT_1300280 [Mycena vulgaris]|nr:hypothetical protein DFH09DRAFT_1300280 [Mycena vulgaris]
MPFALVRAPVRYYNGLWLQGPTSVADQPTNWHLAAILAYYTSYFISSRALCLLPAIQCIYSLAPSSSRLQAKLSLTLHAAFYYSLPLYLHLHPTNVIANVASSRTPHFGVAIYSVFAIGPQIHLAAPHLVSPSQTAYLAPASASGPRASPPLVARR